MSLGAYFLRFCRQRYTEVLQGQKENARVLGKVNLWRATHYYHRKFDLFGLRLNSLQRQISVLYGRLVDRN